MCDKTIEDNESMNSDDSCASISAIKESLENLINKSMKDFGAHNDLELKNNLLKIDAKNWDRSCRNLEGQIKKRNERLEEVQNKLRKCLKSNCDNLDKQLLLTQTDLENVNNLFSTAFEKYSSNFERNVINQCYKENEEQGRALKRSTNELKALQQKEKISDSLIKSKTSEIIGIKQVTNQSFDVLLTRPNIKLEEEHNSLTKEVKQLEARLNVLKSIFKKH